MKLARLKSPLKNISIYSSKGLIIIYGYDEYTGLYSILEINRPAITTEGIIKIKQYQNNLTLNQIITRKKYMKTSYKDMELLYENIPGLYGCIKLLESYYLIIITKITKVGSIIGHTIYTIEETATIPITYGMKNSADEARYKSLLNTFDFTKYLYFSYTYDLTRSWQSQVTSFQNIDDDLNSNTNSNSNSSSNNSQKRSTCQHMFVWNSYALKPFLRGGKSGESLDYWCVPVIYGYINQRNIQLNSNVILKFLLIARRSRLFAGTRYLRRGVDDLGHVANEVETEQIFYILSSQPGYIPRITSLVQCRGSIPLFWSHTNLYSPKPDVQLESDLTMRQMAAKKHFENLFIRYGFNINILNLVKQVDSKGEIMLGTAYKETCESLSSIFTDMRKYHKKSLHKYDNIDKNNENNYEDDDISPITYISYDFLTMAKYQHIAESDGVPGPNVFRDVNKISEKIFPTIGFYVDPPNNKRLTTSYFHFPIKNELKHIDIGMNVDILNEMLEIDNDVNYMSDEIMCQFNTINTLGEGSPYGLLQNGILRTNCMDCLDRTNVAQFCYAKLNIYKQLKSIGLSLLSNGLQEVISICMEVWAEHGDAIAIQYGGSGAMHKVDKQDIGNNSNLNTNNINELSSPPTPISTNNGSINNNNNNNNININNINNSNNINSNVQPVSSDQEFCLTGGSKNALVAVQRYYSNIATDYDRQQSIDLLLGIYEPKKNTIPIWEEKLRTQHLRHGTRGRRQSDITASVQHDLNLLLELDKVTKKEKIRRELMILQSNQLNSKSNDGENRGSEEGNGGFMILHEEEDDDDDDTEDNEDEDDDEETDEDDGIEIWEDSSPGDEEKKEARLSRKSIKIPIPGYNILDVKNQAYFNAGSLAMSSFTEFSNLIEDDNIVTIRLDEINAFPFPPILVNETMWSYWQQQQQQQQTTRIKDLSNSKYIESSEVSIQQTKPLLPQEQLYSDYLNLTYTFTPNIQVSCNCPHTTTTSISPTSSSSSSREISSPQTSKQLLQERKLGDVDIIETLKQEIMKDYFANQNLLLSRQLHSQSYPQQYQSRLSLQERLSDATDNNSSVRESEIQSDIPKSINPSPPPPVSTPIQSSTSTQSNFSITKSGIWPFRKTIKSKPVNDVPIENNTTIGGTELKGQFLNNCQNSKNRTESNESTNSTYLSNTRRVDSSTKKSSRLYENLLKSYIDNTIQEKMQNNINKGESIGLSKDYKSRMSDVE